MNKSLFDRLIHVIVYRGKLIERIFVILTLACLVMFPLVGVNYDLSKYLPESAPTKQALDVMEQEFGYPGMARIMLKDVTLYEAKDIRRKISKVEGVSLVIGADILQDVYMADSFVQNDFTSDFYKDGNAVIDIVFDNGDSDKITHQALDKIYKIAGDNGYFSGSAVANKSRQESITREIAIAIVISIGIIWAILTLTTTSWLEPFLFLAVMIVAIIINMGSNLMFGTISFFTFSTAAILQLAVSMDYSIFLLHTYASYKDGGMEQREAMAAAIKEASQSILASGATTIVGFIVLAFMKFSIGKDVGFVLTKGIITSLATVLILMPALILKFSDKIAKSSHRSFLPSFEPLSKLMYKIRTPVFIFSILIAAPCFVGQGMNHFLYGDQALGASPGSRVYEDTQAINQVFGKSNIMIAMVPNGSAVTERDLNNALKDLPFVNYALSLSGVLPEGVPESFLPAKLVKELRTDRYARYMISMKTEEESSYAFDCSTQLTDLVRQYYPEDSYVIGQTPTTIDIRDIMTTDYNNVSMLSLLGVAAVIFITFRSILVPILVIIPIEVAIYLNMTLPYLMGSNMLYIGYIIVSCLQLGATIDYSILMSTHYLEFRQTMERREAAQEAINRSMISILTSGSILTVVGYLLYFTSSVQAISQVGRLVGRGALLSMMMVLVLLPALLSAFDTPIRKQQARAEKRKQRRLNRISSLKKGSDKDEKKSA